jgi:hypothetical protein
MDRNAVRDQLLADIALAFRDVTRGDGPSLHEAALEGTVAPESRLQARALDTDKSWQEVPEGSLQTFGSIGWLDPQGFRYYAPALMSFALRNYETSDSLVIDLIIYAFDATFRGVGSEYYRQRFSQFDESQSAVVCRFLKFAVEQAQGRMDEDSAGRALAAYWGKFC